MTNALSMDGILITAFGYLMYEISSGDFSRMPHVFIWHPQLSYEDACTVCIDLDGSY